MAAAAVFDLDLRPSDPTFRAGAALAAWQREAAEFGWKVYQEQLARGLDRFGKSMARIGPTARHDRDADKNWRTGRRGYSPMGRAWSGFPALQATGGRSRVRTLLEWRIVGGRIRFGWKFDSQSGRNWGEIVTIWAREHWSRHYTGRKVRIPARDIRGFAPASLRKIETHMRRWEAANRKTWASAIHHGPTPTPAGPPRGPTPGFGPIPPTPAGAIGTNRRGIFGRVGGAVRRAANRVIDAAIERTFGRFTGG